MICKRDVIWPRAVYRVISVSSDLDASKLVDRATMRAWTAIGYLGI